MATMSRFPGSGLVQALPAPASVTRTSTIGDYARLESMGVIRAMQATLVVLAHTVGWSANEGIRDLTPLGRMSVPFYFFVAAFLLVLGLRKSPGRGWLTMCVQRSRRLFVPFLFWSMVFVAIKVAFSLVSGERDPIQFLSWRALTVGGSSHLWFIPALLASTVLAFPIVVWALRSKWLAQGVALVLAVLAAVVALSINPFAVGSAISDTNVETFQLVQWWHRSPAFFIGLACGLCWTPALASAVKSYTGGVIGLVGFVGCAAWLMIDGGRNAAVESIAGACVFVVGAGRLASAVLGPVAGWLEKLGGYSYGVYLIHPLFCWGAMILLNKAGLMQQDWAAFALFAFTMVASFAAVAMARAIKATQHVLPA